MVLLKQLKLVVQQGYGYFIRLDLLHYLRETVLYLRVQISLCEFLVMHGLLGKSKQHLFLEWELA